MKRRKEEGWINEWMDRWKKEENSAESDSRSICEEQEVVSLRLTNQSVHSQPRPWREHRSASLTGKF